MVWFMELDTMVTVLEFLILVVSVSLSQHMILIIWLMLWLWDMFKKIKFFTLSQNLLVALLFILDLKLEKMEFMEQVWPLMFFQRKMKMKKDPLYKLVIPSWKNF